MTQTINILVFDYAYVLILIVLLLMIGGILLVLAYRRRNPMAILNSAIGTCVVMGFFALYLLADLPEVIQINSRSLWAVWVAAILVTTISIGSLVVFSEIARKKLK